MEPPRYYEDKSRRTTPSADSTRPNYITGEQRPFLEYMRLLGLRGKKKRKDQRVKNLIVGGAGDRGQSQVQRGRYAAFLREANIEKNGIGSS